MFSNNFHQQFWIRLSACNTYRLPLVHLVLFDAFLAQLFCNSPLQGTGGGSAGDAHREQEYARVQRAVPRHGTGKKCGLCVGIAVRVLEQQVLTHIVLVASQENLAKSCVPASA